MAIINQAGTACIASDSARSAISRVLKQTSAWLVPPKFWLDANKQANDLAHGFGQLTDKSNYNRDAHEQAVYEIILAGERMAVGLAGEKARTVFWEEFEQRNTTRGGKIWNGKTSHTLSE